MKAEVLVSRVYKNGNGVHCAQIPQGVGFDCRGGSFTNQIVAQLRDKIRFPLSDPENQKWNAIINRSITRITKDQSPFAF